MSNCPHCGLTNRDGARFCQSCGKPLLQPLTPPPATDEAVSSVGAPGGAAAGLIIPPTSETSTTAMHDVGQAVSAAPLPIPAAGPAPASPAPTSADAGLVVEASGASLDRPGTTPLAAPPSAVGPPAVDSEASAAAPTVPLPVAPPVFAALPVGALLDNRRYEVTAVLNEGTKLNAYRIADYGGRHCSQCGGADNAPDEKYCANCGMALSEGPTTFLLREASEADMWEGEALIVERKLWHKGLVNVYRLFEECPYGDVKRFYLVSDPDEGESLAALARPQAEETVLLWGQQLADAIACFHDEGIRHGGIRAASVRLVDSQVKLTNFGRTQKVRRIEGKDWPIQEVADLARMLHDDLLSGQELSPPLTGLFERALSADKDVRYTSARALAADLAKALEDLRRVESVVLVGGSYSHVGVVRDHNEDCLLSLEIQRTRLSECHPLGLYLVADGMGGHEAGEIASGLAVNTVAKVMADTALSSWIAEAQPPNYEGLLKEAFQQANRAVHERRRAARTDMGTTLVGALVVGAEAWVANIGDSRCYHLSRQQLAAVTSDHSLVERLVATGQITREEARVHPQRNYIYRTVGDKPQVEVDMFKVSLKPGDCLVLCSDGLNSMIEDAQIEQAVLNNPHPQAACEQLVRLANAAGGDDNVTVIVVQALEMAGSK